MSVKGKNLSYEAQEPSFLRRLRAQHGGMDNDRHERPVARPKRVIVNHGDDDDGPTYVDEASNMTLTKEEYESMLRDADGSTSVEKGNIEDNPEDAPKPALPDDQQNARKTQEITEVGKAQKKRKVAKVVGDSEEAQAEAENHFQPAARKKATKKKAKAVKLSFGNEEPEDS